MQERAKVSPVLFEIDELRMYHGVCMYVCSVEEGGHGGACLDHGLGNALSGGLRNLVVEGTGYVPHVSATVIPFLQFIACKLPHFGGTQEALSQEKSYCFDSL